MITTNTILETLLGSIPMQSSQSYIAWLAELRYYHAALKTEQAIQPHERRNSWPTVCVGELPKIGEYIEIELATGEIIRGTVVTIDDRPGERLDVMIEGLESCPISYQRQALRDNEDTWWTGSSAQAQEQDRRVGWRYAEKPANSEPEAQEAPSEESAEHGMPDAGDALLYQPRPLEGVSDAQIQRASQDLESRQIVQEAFPTLARASIRPFDISMELAREHHRIGVDAEHETPDAGDALLVREQHIAAHGQLP